MEEKIFRGFLALSQAKGNETAAQNNELDGNDTKWNFCTIQRQSEPFIFQTVFSQPTKQHPVAGATCSVWFTVNLEKKSVSYRFEHSSFEHSFSTDADLEQVITEHASLVANPLARVKEVIKSKLISAKNGIDTLFPPRKLDFYGQKDGPVNFTPLPIVQFNTDDIALIMNRSHLTAEQIAKIPTK